jgi:tetratricopeptide (TPR) repeat protein
MSTDNSSPQPQPVSKLHRRLVECYRRGLQLMQVDKNYDYAHTMFAECVVHDPANLTYVETLLKNLRTKFPKPSKRSSLLIRRDYKAVRQACEQKNWSKVRLLGLDLLKENPWDIATLRSLAIASANSHHNEVELVYLKQALDTNPRDLTVNRHCAQSLARLGQFDQAIACWHRLEVLRPGDKEAARMIAYLAEEKLKYPSGRPPVASASTSTTTEPASRDDVYEEQESAMPQITLNSRQLLQRAIADDPYDVSNYLKLADLFSHQNDLQEAENIITQGLSVCSENLMLKDRLQQVQMLRLQQLTEESKLRKKQIERRNRPFRMPWLEIALSLAGCVLLAQLFPAVGWAVWAAIDPRHWSQSTWFIVNFLFVLILILIRYVPQFFVPQRKNHSRAKS